MFLSLYKKIFLSNFIFAEYFMVLKVIKRASIFYYFYSFIFIFSFRSTVFYYYFKPEFKKNIWQLSQNKYKIMTVFVGNLKHILRICLMCQTA